MLPRVRRSHTALSRREFLGIGTVGLLACTAPNPLANSRLQTPTWQHRGTLKHMGRIFSLAYSPDGSTLAVGVGDGDPLGGRVQLWDVAERKELYSLEGHAHRVYSVAFSPDGETLASGSEDHTAKLWNVTTGQQRATLAVTSSGGVNSVAFSPDGKTLATGSVDGFVKLWDLTTMRQGTTLTHTGTVSSVAFSPDGETLAVGVSDWAALGSRDKIKLWDLTGGEAHLIVNLIPKEPNHTVHAVTFSSDGKTLAASGWGAHPEEHHPIWVKLWDVKTRRELITLKPATRGVTSLSFSPDDTVLATAQGETKLWDIATGQERTTLPTARVWAIAFSPGGTILATGNVDGEVELWERPSGR